MATPVETIRAAVLGNPPDPLKQPDNELVVRAFAELFGGVTSLAAGLVIGGAVVYATRSALYADLAHDAGTLGVVYADGTAAYNGIYVKAGASGGGSWSLTTLALPATFAADLDALLTEISNARDGAGNLDARLDADVVTRIQNDVTLITSVGGTADAITGTVAGTDAGNRFYILTPTANNTGEATLALNGGSALPILDANNQVLGANELRSGRRYMMRNFGNASYRIVGSMSYAQFLAEETSRIAGDIQNVTSVSGTADAIMGTVAGTDAPGRRYRLIPASNNTGTVTLALNGGSALPLYDAANAAITAANAIRAGRRLIVENFANTTYRIINSAISEGELALKAPIANPTFTGTVSGITKAMVGLGNVDNTSDATKNAAAATLTNKTLTAPVINSPTGIVKGDVGLGNVDNTSDANKPVSTAQAAADLIQIESIGGTADAITGTVTGTDANRRRYVLIPSAANTGTLTLALNGGSALPVFDSDNVAITAANGIKAGRRYILQNYSNASYRIVNSVISEAGFNSALALKASQADLDLVEAEIETGRGGYPNLNARLNTFDAAAAVADDIDAPAPGTAWSLSGKDGQVLAWLDGNGKFVNPAAARGVVPGAPHTAFGAEHLSVRVPGDASYGGFYTFVDPTDYPIMWSPRAQYPHGPVIELDGAVAVPAPMLREAAGRASQYAIYPLPSGTRKLTNGTALEFIFQWGQSLGIWSSSGGPMGQAWKATLEWAGTNVSPLLKMFNGGLRQPGMSGDSAVNGADQASLVDAVDQSYNVGTIYDVGGNPVDSGPETVSSPGIVHMIRRALGADGLRFSKTVAMGAFGVGGQSITYYKSAGDGGTSNWFANVLEDTLANIVTAAASYSSVKILHAPLEQGEADAQNMTKATYRGHLDQAVAAVQSAIMTAFSQSEIPIISHTQIGTALLSTGATTTGRPAWEVSDVALAIMEKGISTDTADLRYICVGPRYDQTFITISHMDHIGYLQGQERTAYVLNEDERLRAEGVQPKWLPAHATAVALQTIGGRPFVVIDCHVPFPPLRIDTLLVPKKTNFGFHFRGGSNTPTVTDCFIGPRGDKVYLELSEAWAGTGRFFGVAAKASAGRQGWLTADETPATAWAHPGMGCNICDSAPWSSIVTGRRLPNFLLESLHAIAD